MRFHASSLLVLLCAAGALSTLSKSNRKKVTKADKNDGKDETKSTVARLKEEILASHAEIDSGERQFSGPVFGYVTPWNNHGYDVAKWAANKFTHIVPVWFQINALSTSEKSCSIGGTHDMDQGWIADIRSNNSEIKIFPRFLFESWNTNDLEDFLVDEGWQIRCGKEVINFLQRNRFDGAVLEIWLQIMSMTRGHAGRMVSELLEDWADRFHKKDLLIVIPIPPPLRDSHEDVGLFSPSYLEKLVRKVDYVNVMTYDFPSAKPSGVAPYDWVLANLEWIIKAGVEPSKILIGINFYGYDRTNGRMDAVTANR
ncbi:hypothetical protein L596_014966 [Steinernema carpocapsae]|uniref:Chitinase domain-containing protein 1 n=1 Tax=Steinernema carpocapsae TaxID=34508 RepID=A0A4U5NDT2_STECR|nr:hypothetical protein L596_014966 [Steinernema carpocapsae]